MTLTDPHRPLTEPRLRSALRSPVALLVGLAMVVRLVLMVRRPLGPDEGGFLIVGSQWSHGSSLYGHYWVDRPPLLIAFFGLADALGGALALRLLGVVLVGVAVAAAGRIGRLASPVGAGRRTSVVAAAVAATFLSTPLFGVEEVNGELIGVTVLLAGSAAYLDALRSTGPRRTAGLVLSGGLAATAMLVKQNELDLVVLVIVTAFTTLRSLPGAPRRRTAIGLPALGAVAVAAATLALAATRGTSPSGLWQAVVVFRFHASAVIASSAASTNHARLESLLLALALSGAPLVVLALIPALAGRPQPGSIDLRAPVVALLLSESVSVFAGGSFWHHYLICYVPGIVLSAVVTSLAGLRPVVARVAMVYAGLATVLSVGVHDSPFARPSTPPLLAWLQTHTHPGESAVIAFGQADYLQQTGLVSPYSELWSLPVRVRDPQLTEFTALLASPGRPCVVVTDSTGLPGWGLDATRAVPVLESHYRRVAVVDDHPIWQADTCQDPDPQVR